MIDLGRTASTSEAKRMIKQGAVSIDGDKISAENQKITAGESCLFKVGNRKFMKVSFVERPKKTLGHRCFLICVQGIQPLSMFLPMFQSQKCPASPNAQSFKHPNSPKKAQFPDPLLKISSNPGNPNDLILSILCRNLIPSRR